MDNIYRETTYIYIYIFIWGDSIYIYIHRRLGGVSSPLGRPPRNREIVSCRACVRADPMLRKCISNVIQLPFPFPFLRDSLSFFPCGICESVGSSGSQSSQWAGPNGPGPMGRAQWAGHNGAGTMGWAQRAGAKWVEPMHGPSLWARPMGRVQSAGHNGPGTTGRDYGPSPWARSLAKGSTRHSMGHGPWPMAPGPGTAHGPMAHGQI
jgi:hypothetical protein